MSADNDATKNQTALSGLGQSHWFLGLVMGLVVGVAAWVLPVVSRLQGDDTFRWLMLVTEQFGANLDLVGWAVIGVVTAILGMVVALIAFVGMRENAVGSQRRRDLLVEASGFLVVVATALSTIMAFAIPFAAIPAPQLQALSHPGLTHAPKFDEMLLDSGSGDALRLQTSLVLIGFVAIGLLGISKYMDRAVRTWFADEDDMQRTERRLFSRRIDARATRLLEIDTLWRSVPESSPIWLVRLRASAATGLAALLGAGANTLVVSILRGATGRENNGWELFAWSALAAALQAVVVSLALLSLWRVSLEGPQLQWSTSLRWNIRRVSAWVRALIATVALPALFVIARYDAEDLGTLWRALATVALLFGLPTFVCWLRGSYSWFEVAALQTKKALRASIQDDEDRLRRLPTPADRTPAVTSPVVVAAPRVREISFLGIRISWG